LWNPEICYHVHKSPPPVAVLSQISPVPATVLDVIMVCDCGTASAVDIKCCRYLVLVCWSVCWENR